MTESFNQVWLFGKAWFTEIHIFQMLTHSIRQYDEITFNNVTTDIKFLMIGKAFQSTAVRGFQTFSFVESSSLVIGNKYY